MSAALDKLIHSCFANNPDLNFCVFILARSARNLKVNCCLDISSENMAVGKHKVLFNAENFASGMYIYKITVNGFTSAGKIVLMK